MSLLFRPLVAGAVASAKLVTAVTWSPSDKDATITLSNANMTAALSTSTGAVRANAGKVTGKWYCEMVYDAINTGSHTPWFGLANLSNALGSGMFTGVTSGLAAQQNGIIQPTFASYAGFSAGDVAQIAWDASGGKLWLGRNNTWYTGSPAGGTSPLATGLSAVAWFPAAYFSGSATQQLTLRAKSSAFTYSPPSGFNAWQS